MAAWRYLACNAFTNVVVAELPLKTPSFTRVLNDSGTYGAVIPLADPGVRRLALTASGAVEPALTALYCQRDGATVWGGILWGTVYDSTTQQLTLRGGEFGTYLAFRFLTSGGTFTGDMATLAKNWAINAFGDSGPPLTTRVTLSGNSQTVVTQAWEQHNVLDLVKAFHVAIGGYDWAFDTTIDSNGNPSCLFTVSAPRRGVSYVKSGVIWDYPGPEVISYNVQRDGDQLMTNLFATGAGSGGAQLHTEATKASSYLKMQATASNSDLTTQASLNSWAQGLMKLYGDPPPQVVKARLTGDAFFKTGLSVGDEATLQVSDPYLVGALPGRILQWTANPATDQSPEFVDVIFGAPL